MVDKKTKEVEVVLTPTQLKAKRKRDINSYLRTYRKNVETKGGEVIVGFGKDLPQELLEMHKQPIDIVSFDIGLAGGAPLGGAFTVAGGEGVAKTTLALRIIAALQRQDKICCLIDAEHSFDAAWAQKQGVNVDELILVQGDTLEDTLNLAVDIIRRGLIDFGILDSMDSTIARQSMSSKKGKERDLDNDDVALKARQFSRFFPRILHSLRTKQIGFMLIAQYRTSGIGTAWVNPFNISGGNARKYYDWMTLTLRRGSRDEQLVDEATGKVIAWALHIDVKKSKMPGVREGDTFSTMFFNEIGFNNDYEKVKLAYDNGIIERVNNANHIYTATDGTEHKISFGKEQKVLNQIIEMKLVDDVWAKYTGDVGS